MRVKRLDAGKYQTLDGQFEITKDPDSGNEKHGCGYTSWLIYRVGERDAEPVWFCGSYVFGTLREAKEMIENYKPM